MNEYEQNFKPLNNRILVKKLKKPSETASGIIIKSYAKDKFVFGEVLSGTDEIETGWIIMFNPLSGKELDKENTLLIKEDVYGVMKDKDSVKDYAINIKDFSIIHENDVIVKVKSVKKEVTHSSGIILTSNASGIQDRPTNGCVYAKGSGVSSLDINDKVEFEVTSGIDLDSNDETGEHYVIMDIARVLGKYTA